MAAGDCNIDQCPVCKAQNNYTSVQIREHEDKLWFQVTCSRCGFIAPADLKREEAINKWNMYQRKDRISTF